MDNKLHDYTIVVGATITLATSVRASSLQEALDLAAERRVPGLCDQCAGDQYVKWATSGALDCEPVGSPIVEVFCDNQAFHSDELADIDW